MLRHKLNPASLVVVVAVSALASAAHLNGAFAQTSGGAAGGASPNQTRADHAVYVPMIMTKPNNTGPITPTPPPTPPTPPPAQNKLPAELVGTWFTGSLLPLDFYDPGTGHWSDPGGVGQMYVFEANGKYTYTGFASTSYGNCRGEVSVYQTGVASANGASLTITAQQGKTRTVTICGTRTETVSATPEAPKTIPWRVGYDDGGHTNLFVHDYNNDYAYYRAGIPADILGNWHRGEVRSTSFFNPATQVFEPQTGPGAFLKLKADGTYVYGEFGYGKDNNNCDLSGWLYETGNITVSGSKITFAPTSAMSRVESACDPGNSKQGAYTGTVESYTWFFRDRTTAPKFVMIWLTQFREYEYVPE